MSQLYKIIYLIGQTIPKRDRFGIHTVIDKACLGIFSLSCQSTVEDKTEKLPSLRKLRTQIEVFKRLIRIEHELKIIPDKHYFEVEGILVEISMMTNGWIKYVSKRGG